METGVGGNQRRNEWCNTLSESSRAHRVGRCIEAVPVISPPSMIPADRTRRFCPVFRLAPCKGVVSGAGAMNIDGAQSVERLREQNKSDPSSIVETPRLHLPLDKRRRAAYARRASRLPGGCGKQASASKCSKSRTRRSAVPIIRPVDDTTILGKAFCRVFACGSVQRTSTCGPH